MNTLIKKILLILSRGQKKFLVLILVLSLISALFEILSLGLLIPLLNIFLNNDIQQYKESFDFIKDSSEQEILVLILLGFLFVYFIKVAVNVFLVFFNNKFKKNLLKYLSSKLLNNYLNLNISKLVNINSSFLIRNIWTETVTFAYGLISSITTLITELIVFLFITVLLLFYNFKTSLLLLIYFGTLATYFYFKNSKKLKDLGDIKVEYNALILKELRQSIGSIKEIYLYGLQKIFLKNFEQKVSIISSSMEKRENIIQLPRHYIEFLSITSLIIIIFFELFNKNNLNEIFVLIGLYVFASIRLMPGIVKILQSFQNIKYNIPVVNLLNEELGKYKNQNTFQKNFENNQNKFTFENLTLKNVFFSYQNKNFNETEVLKDINIKIIKGDKIGIYGKSGSGKTTLVNLLSGFCEAKSGEMLINDKKDNLNKYLFERSIGYVQQSTYVADETVKFNITLKKNNNEIDFNKLDKILKILNIDQIISELPNGIDTSMGEKGSKFSGGQIQRIGIARAIYRNPEILILDEATNALDITSQDQILKNIFEEFKNKTVILISHQSDNFNYCNKKYLLENKLLKNLN